MSPTLSEDGSVLSWASTLEPQAMEQARRTASMPFVVTPLALMPDAHLGKGSTVGSVIATEGAIIPAAVGVDIGCVDRDTEYLSPMGWVPISEYVGGPVMQYHPETGMASFTEPVRYIKREQTEPFLHFRTKYGVDQMLTGDHRVLRWQVKGRARNEVMEVVSAAEHAAEHERLVLGSKARFETTFSPALTTALPLNEDELRVQVMFMADGHLDRHAGVLRFKKARKIERCEKLLDAADIVYTKRVNSDAVTTFRITPPMETKTYGDLWDASLDQLRVIAEECLHWDGSIEDRVFFTSDPASADFMQYCFSAVGYRAVLRAEDREGREKIEYRVFAHTSTRIAMVSSVKTEIDRVPSADGFAYCFTVPSGFLVLRRSGNVFVTGNCGMAAVETRLTSHDLPDNLDALHAAIRAAVPAGVGKGHENQGVRAFDHIKREPSTWLSEKQRNTALAQFGTLGSGNHFVEVCLDERDVVWIVLHSGSRGIGNQLATAHIKVATGLMKEYFINLPDPDLAYLVQGTKPFTAYVKDMLWAQEYAAANRARMLDLVVLAFETFLGRHETVQSMINCHHNFTQQESHRGRNLWITRKGAISARAGQKGIIPGSMGTRSYIVEGLGNEASFMSCSHGAGRRLSRSAANKTLSVESLRTAMEGRTWNESDAEKLVDEHPLSYKDIDQVMADQADLVRPLHTLSQILNYKGV